MRALANLGSCGRSVHEFVYPPARLPGPAPTRALRRIAIVRCAATWRWASIALCGSQTAQASYIENTIRLAPLASDVSLVTTSQLGGAGRTEWELHALGFERAALARAPAPSPPALCALRRLPLVRLDLRACHDAGLEELELGDLANGLPACVPSAAVVGELAALAALRRFSVRPPRPAPPRPAPPALPAPHRPPCPAPPARPARPAPPAMPRPAPPRPARPARPDARGAPGRGRRRRTGASPSTPRPSPASSVAGGGSSRSRRGPAPASSPPPPASRPAPPAPPRPPAPGPALNPRAGAGGAGGPAGLAALGWRPSGTCPRGSRAPRGGALRPAPRRARPRPRPAASAAAPAALAPLLALPALRSLRLLLRAPPAALPAAPRPPHPALARLDLRVCLAGPGAPRPPPGPCPARRARGGGGADLASASPALASPPAAEAPAPRDALEVLYTPSALSLRRRPRPDLRALAARPRAPFPAGAPRRAPWLPGCALS
eukprot:tig00020704_g13182.t1